MMKFVLSVLTISAVFSAAFANHRYEERKMCGESKKCMEGLLKCRFMVMGMDKEEICQKEDMIEKTGEMCLEKLGFMEEFEEFEDEIGQYMYSPYMSFIQHLMKDEPKKVGEIMCCVGKGLDMIDDDGTVRVKYMKAYMLEKVDKSEEQLLQAADYAFDKCPGNKKCDAMQVKKCVMENCFKYMYLDM